VRLPVHTAEYRNVDILTREYWEKGHKHIRRTLRTPIGEIYQTLVPDISEYQSSHWIKEHFIKQPDDFRVMEYALRDPQYHPNFEVLMKTIRRIGDDGLVCVRLAKSPIQEMLYQMMGYEGFAVSYYESRDLFDSLHHTMTVRYDELYDLAAESPVEIILLGDNITADVIGTERFRKYLMPEYKKLKKRLSESEKKLAVHMDGRLASLAQSIWEAEFDIIEAITPPPVGDVSIQNARSMWGEKSLWINFTSSIFIETPAAVEEHTRSLIEQAGSKSGFAIGITEDAPIDALERSMKIISQVAADY
jgi:uroporphyrinogen-III decarboxylase